MVEKIVRPIIIADIKTNSDHKKELIIKVTRNLVQSNDKNLDSIEHYSYAGSFGNSKFISINKYSNGSLVTSNSDDLVQELNSRVQYLYNMFIDKISCISFYFVSPRRLLINNLRNFPEDREIIKSTIIKGLEELSTN